MEFKAKTAPPNLSVQDCKNACADYNYFALQNSGGECWCENNLQRITMHGEANCNANGGGLCNYVYDNLCAGGLYAAG